MGKQGNIVLIVLSFWLTLVGGVWGILVGYNYAYSKHKNNDGVEYFIYNESTRKYGKWMLILGGIILAIFLLSKSF